MSDAFEGAEICDCDKRSTNSDFRPLEDNPKFASACLSSSTFLRLISVLDKDTDIVFATLLKYNFKLARATWSLVTPYKCVKLLDVGRLKKVMHVWNLFQAI